LNGYGCDKNSQLAFTLYKQNWEENKHVNSLHHLACCYSTGNGCDKNPQLAFTLYKQNWEENKHYTSLYNLAYCYSKGEGCEKDTNLAAYYKKIYETKDI
jgi:TPR repeat protein